MDATYEGFHGKEEEAEQQRAPEQAYAGFGSGFGRFFLIGWWSGDLTISSFHRFSR